MGNCHSKKNRKYGGEYHPDAELAQDLEKPFDALRSTGDVEDLDHLPSFTEQD